MRPDQSARSPRRPTIWPSEWRAAPLYASLGRARRFAPEPIPGILFGTLVWAVSYAGWVPAARILPPPQDDDPERVATMIGAHVVYGAVLGRECAEI